MPIKIIVDTNQTGTLVVKIWLKCEMENKVENFLRDFNFFFFFARDRFLYMLLRNHLSSSRSYECFFVDKIIVKVNLNSALAAKKLDCMGLLMGKF